MLFPTLQFLVHVCEISLMLCDHHLHHTRYNVDVAFLSAHGAARSPFLESSPSQSQLGSGIRLSLTCQAFVCTRHTYRACERQLCLRECCLPYPPCVTHWLAPWQRGNAQPQGNTGPYGGDVKPKVSNNPYGGGAKQASNPYGGVIMIVCTLLTLRAHSRCFCWSWVLARRFLFVPCEQPIRWLTNVQWPLEVCFCYAVGSGGLCFCALTLSLAKVSDGFPVPVGFLYGPPGRRWMGVSRLQFVSFLRLAHLHC